ATAQLAPGALRSTKVTVLLVGVVPPPVKLTVAWSCTASPRAKPVAGTWPPSLWVSVVKVAVTGPPPPALPPPPGRTQQVPASAEVSPADPYARVHSARSLM